MLSKTKKPQLRRCAFCNRAGHNKATCDEYRTSLVTEIAPPRSTVQPLRFFVHHVSSAPTHSPHVVDLKPQRSDIWDQIETVTGDDEQSLYHHYHEAAPKQEKKSLFVDLHEEKEKIVLPEIVVEEKVEEKIEEKYFEPTTTVEIKTEEKSTPKITLAEKMANKFSAIKLEKIITPSRNFFNQTRQAFSAKKLAYAAVLLLIVAVVPAQATTFYRDIITTKDMVAEDGTAGFLALQNSTLALKQADIDTAEATTKQALYKFNMAVSTLQNNHQILQTLASLVPVIGDEIQDRQKLLMAGQQISLGNSFLLDGIKESQENSKAPLTENLEIVIKHLKAALPNYEKASTNLAEIDANSLPPDYQNQFSAFRKLFQSAIRDFNTIADLGDTLKEIFGGVGMRRYLLVFQNQAEIRPTGGFMGSFAVIDIKNGKIIKMTVPPGGTYELQGLLRDYVEPPTPLLLSNKRWEFQDANWFPDFPASAQKMLWFFSESYPITADGVIAINASVLERLLGVIGPVTDTKRDITLSSDNALVTLQKIVEEGPDKKENKPKQIIADLAPQFINYFENLSAKNILPLLINFQEALEQKEIQAYFTDSRVQETVSSLGWGGQILKTQADQDYLFVVNTNIQGQKSDAKIKQTISHQASIAEDGTIIDNIVITREHTGNNGEKLYGETNVDYMRVYVPQGSQLISANGFSWPDENNFKVSENFYTKDKDLSRVEKEISVDSQSGTRVTEELGKTAFGNWIVTEPGATTQVQIAYRLPFKLQKTDSLTNGSTLDNFLAKLGEKLTTYQIVVQKQSGINTKFESQIIFPDKTSPLWQNGTNIALARNGATIKNTDLLTDSVWSVVVKNIK